MQTKAALMVLVLLSGTIAGCTSDPDGGGNDGIDSDALDDLFDEYFQDFVNNTSITVNNHYHNNTTYVVDDGDYSTTVVNEYNNTTINEGDETSTNNYNNQTDNDYSSSNSSYSFNGSGAGSGSIMQMFTVEWSHTETQIEDYGSRIVTLNDTLQQTSGNPYLLYALIYEGNLIEFENINCEQIRNFGWLGDNAWENYLEGAYGGNANTEGHQLDDFWRDLLYEYDNNLVNSDGETARTQCHEFGGYDYNYTPVFEIALSAGESLQFLSLPNLHDVILQCDDGYESSANNGSAGIYLGGQANCTVTGIVEVRSNHQYDHVSGDWGGTNNSSSGSSTGYSNIPDWWPHNSWYFYGGHPEYGYHTYSETPSEFAVYYTTYFVEVYDGDLE